MKTNEYAVIAVDMHRGHLDHDVATQKSASGLSVILRDSLVELEIRESP